MQYSDKDEILSLTVQDIIASRVLCSKRPWVLVQEGIASNPAKHPDILEIINLRIAKSVNDIGRQFVSRFPLPSPAKGTR